jgi:hypothetical protein
VAAVEAVAVAAAAAAAVEAVAVEARNGEACVTRTEGCVRVRVSRCRLCSCGDGGWSGGFQDGQHGHAPAEEEQSAAISWDMLVVVGSEAQEVAEFVVTSAEPGG